MKKDKILGIVTEDEMEDLNDQRYLERAARRILADVEMKNEKWWKKIRKKYKIKKNKTIAVDRDTREIYEMARKIKLGNKVRCKTDGFEGVVTSIVEYLNGCVQCGIRRAVDKDGKRVDVEYIDIKELEIVRR